MRGSQTIFLMTTRWCVSATCGIFLWAAWSRRPKPQNRARSFVSGLPFGSQPVYWVGDRGRRRGARAPGMMLPSAPESPHELEPFTILHHFHIEYHNSFSLIHMLQMLFTDNINTNGCLTTHATRRVVSVAVATDPPPGPLLSLPCSVLDTRTLLESLVLHGTWRV
jgi:hypothetical protein